MRSPRSLVMQMTVFAFASFFVTAALTTLAPVKQAHAASCNSATKVGSDLWKKYSIVVKAAGCGVAQGYGVPIMQCLQTANKVDKAMQKMVAFFNKNAKNGWATLGPRRLDFGKTHQGKLVSTGGRMFISAFPSKDKELEFTLTKVKGKAAASVVVCTWTQGTKKQKKWEFRVPKNAKVGSVYKRKVSGVYGNFVSVHIDSKNLVQGFKYKLKTKVTKRSSIKKASGKASSKKRPAKRGNRR